MKGSSASSAHGRGGRGMGGAVVTVVLVVAMSASLEDERRSGVHVGSVFDAGVRTALVYISSERQEAARPSRALIIARVRETSRSQISPGGLLMRSRLMLVLIVILSPPLAPAPRAAAQ